MLSYILVLALIAEQAAVLEPDAFCGLAAELRVRPNELAERFRRGAGTCMQFRGCLPMPLRCSALVPGCVCTPAAQRARVHDLPDDHPRGGHADTDVQGTPDLLPQSPLPSDMPAVAPAARVPATRLSD